MDIDKLISDYLDHPMHKDLRLNLTYKKGVAKLVLDVMPQNLNLVGILHGSFFFKLMDDACFFSIMTINNVLFVATSNFSVTYFRPVLKGKITATASVIESSDFKYFCQCIIVNEFDDKIASGSGTFIKPKKTIDF